MWLLGGIVARWLGGPYSGHQMEVYGIILTVGNHTSGHVVELKTD